MAATPAPLALHAETVRPEWIDYNGHMNVAYYVLAFDHATDALFDHLGLGEGYRHAANASLFIAEAHVLYRRELAAGAPMRFETQLLDRDAKRLQFFHRMLHGGEGFLAATCELVAVHVDLAHRRATPFPAEAAARLEALADRHAHLRRPAEAGRAIGLGRARA